MLSVTLNRPDKLNALTPPMVYRLREALTAAARDPQVRCVVIKCGTRLLLRRRHLAILCQRPGRSARCE